MKCEPVENFTVIDGTIDFDHQQNFQMIQLLFLKLRKKSSFTIVQLEDVPPKKLFASFIS